MAFFPVLGRGMNSKIQSGESDLARNATFE
jgi:hypothetical protein